MAQRKKEKQALAKDNEATYNAFKEFEGQRYTGMKIGRSHSWHYDKGDWKEKKISPDEWQINYNVTKRRAGHAPEGSGVPVGTQYHWYIIAHQNVTKLNADDYSTSLTGLKFKLAHKRAGKETWSASVKAQRNRTIKILKSIIDDLEKQQREEERTALIAKEKTKTIKNFLKEPENPAKKTKSTKAKRRTVPPATKKSSTRSLHP